ncbi:MAG: peptidoglycan DD-metalloendopeptidase family protein [Microcoleus sp.]
MKRAYPQKLKPVEASEIERDGLAEPSKQQTIESLVTASSGRVRSLATLGLAISVGASGILLPRSGDSARATEPAPTAESTIEVQPVSSSITANAARVDGSAVPSDLASTGNGMAGDTVLPVSSQPNIPTAEAIGLETGLQQQAATAPTVAIDPNQDFNLTDSQAQVSAPTATVPEIALQETASTPWLGGNGAIDSLKKQENRTTVRPVELGFEEPASSSKSAVIIEESGSIPSSPAATTTKTAIPDLSATSSVIPTAQTDAPNWGVKQESTTAQPFESIEQSPGIPSLPAAAVAPSVENSMESTIAPAPVLYSVRPGDTLSAIAKGHGVSAQELIAVNKLGDPNFLNVNQRLKIPQKIGSNNSAVRAAASTSASNSTSVPSVAGTPGVLLPSSPAPEFVNSGVASPAPVTVPVVSPLANVEGLKNISTPIVPKINSIPLTQVSQSMSESGRLELQGEPTFTGAVDTSALPVPAGATASTNIANSYPQPTNLMPANGTNRVVELPPSEGSMPSAQALNPYAERLRAEVVRLREEYRAERNSIGANAVSLAVAESEMPIATGSPADNIQNLNPNFRSTEYAQAVQDEIARPSSRAWSDRVQRQQTERFDPMRAAELQPINLTPASAPVEQPVVATAPLGSQGYDPLSNPSLGRMVSPELPPLSGADTYLPDGGKLQQQSANGFIWPAKGVLTSGYGWRWGRMHRGIDIAGPIGTPIVAADSGVVTYADWNDGGYGYLVEITHADGSQTIYAHNSRILVQKGQQVAQGEQISEMGSTGFSTGPHLHFEIHPAGQGAVNPMAFLPDEDSRASR